MQSSPHESGTQSRRGRLPVGLTAIVVGALLLAVAAGNLYDGSSSDNGRSAAAVSNAPPPRADDLDRSIDTMRSTLRRNPHDAAAWARLGGAYVEQARVTADPGYYAKAEGALRRSMDEQPSRNGLAWIGMGALENAKHDFGSARDWGERARRVLPDTAAVYGVLADAYTELGDEQAATTALQRMLDLKPSVASFTRASYNFELRGRIAEARDAMERAHADTSGPADASFCRYYLGELEYNTGRLDAAERHYEQGLAADPDNVQLLQGKAKVAAARGQADAAVRGYQDVVSRVPSPEYLQEYARLLRSLGRRAEADKQYEVLAAQQRLLTAAGAADALVASSVAADRGRKTEALRLAEQEWARRQHVDVADVLAWALHLNGRDAEALTYAERADRLGGKNAQFAYHRGMILRALDRTDEARAALRTALRTNPYFSPLDAPRARSALNALRSEQ